MHSHQRCPNCGRQITDDEIYCYFCELEISKLKNRENKHSGSEKH